MTLTETVIEALRNYYDIPADVEGIRVDETVEYDYHYTICSCCEPTSSARIETQVWYYYVPAGRKRKVAKTYTYSGPLWELLEQIENMSE